MKDEYEAAFSDLTLGENPAKPVDDTPLEDPAPKVTPEKEAAMASATSEAKAFSDAWNGDAGVAEKPAKPQSFGQAFKAARASGAKTFEFKGKQYTTALKSDKPAINAPSAASQMPAPRDDQATERPVSKRRPSIYEAENPIRSGVNAVKKAVAFVADGGLNLSKK